ncbi:MAG TPA: MurR/RpiR family transcriptional regulator [Candidatus Lachnoclostridium pullistercoris]|uniref:MurR/RpiR family transcriptional regulator n=1 Tax=Candidatus Lachnoclostridium pullistercoris TaxID=2838632 RepID=A0A9D2PEQ1_9FIRM|nr:MurR/RpiR family transcriptional regulator [Candidatus Lachnoclostridium pullistercoris]
MTVLEQLEAAEDFTYVERKIAAFILEHKDEIGVMTISGLAAATYSSNAAIIRMCRKMGMKGYKEFRIQLVRDIERRQREKLPVNMDRPFYKEASASDIVKQISDLMTETIRTCYESMPVRELERAARWIVEADTIYIHAVGDSMISAIAFSNRLIKLNKRAVVVNQYGEEWAYVRNAGRRDVMMVISYSGHNLLKRNLCAGLRRKGCRTILISSLEKVTDYDAVIRFPARESYESYGGKMATYYSQTAISCILNCIYGIAFAKIGE